MANKANFARQGQQMAASFSALADDIAALKKVYWDRGYNSGNPGGADPLTDEDVASLGVTATNVTEMADAFAGALAVFMVANQGYLSKMRNDL